MRIKMTKDVDVLDERGEVRFTHEKGSAHDFSLSEAAAYIAQDVAEPADESAAEDLQRFLALPEETRAQHTAPSREISISDDGRAVESVG